MWGGGSVVWRMQLGLNNFMEVVDGELKEVEGGGEKNLRKKGDEVTNQ